jgi:hypothetical protein
MNQTLFVVISLVLGFALLLLLQPVPCGSYDYCDALNAKDAEEYQR